ncbi:MAG TPA: hypothetical protein VGG40_11970 [Solirubrobacterales bacterium]|jgi:hypothetical protein
MADQNPTAHSATDAGDDLQDQALVLDRLLVHWPTHLQEGDLQRELQLGEDDFDHRDRVDRAVAQLHWVGLALRSDPVVIPTRAALHYHALSACAAADL